MRGTETIKQEKVDAALIEVEKSFVQSRTFYVTLAAIATALLLILRVRSK